MGPLLAGGWNICPRVGPLINYVAGSRHTRPAVPREKGYVVRAPFHLGCELAGGRLHVKDYIARNSVRLYDELGVIRVRNESARAAIFVIEFLPGGSINEQRRGYGVQVKLVEM